MEIYWIIIPCSKTNEHHTKIVGGNFKENRRRYFFIQHVGVRWLSILPQEAEDAIRQTDKGTQKHQWSANHKSLEAKGLFWRSISLYLRHLCWPLFLLFLCFVEKRDFIQGSSCTVSYLSCLLNSYTQQRSPLSALMLLSGDGTQAVTPHYSMENIQIIAVVQMLSFRKQEDLGGKWTFRLKTILTFFLWKRGPSLPAVLGHGK